MKGTEKMTNEVRIKLTDSQLIDATKASIIEDRTVTDLVHHGFLFYMYGYAARLPECCEDTKETNKD